MGKRAAGGKGTCSVCGNVFTFRTDGKLRQHERYTDGYGNRALCLGWDLPPQEVKNG